MGRFKDLALKKEDKKRRRADGFSFVSYLLISSIIVCSPFTIIGVLINSKHGGPIGVVVGVAILAFIIPNISRNIIALTKHGMQWRTFVWSSKHKISINWHHFFKLAEAEQVHYKVIEKRLHKWLDENTSHWQEVYGEIYFQKEEDLIHFKLVWY